MSEAFPDVLVALRKGRGMSQAQLGVAAGVGQGQVSRFEGGVRTPSRDAVDRLGDAMTLAPEERARLEMSAGFFPSDLSSLPLDELYYAYVTAVSRAHGVTPPVIHAAMTGAISLMMEVAKAIEDDVRRLAQLEEESRGEFDESE